MNERLTPAVVAAADDDLKTVLRNRYQKLPQSASSASRTGLDPEGETVEEFVAYFYECVREDAAAVAALDRVLKARYAVAQPLQQR